MRIFVIIGTRPEAIKMLPLAIELRKYNELETKICFSSQHREMAKSVFEEFKIHPDFTFHGMKTGMNLKKITSILLNYFDVIFNENKPDLVLVHGDTTTAFCAALSAFYLGIKVAHIEAGLRTFDSKSPFPEEFNRVAIDAISEIHFAPTESSAENLRREGRKSVFIVGNTVIDALNFSLSSGVDTPLSEELSGKKLVLVTTHRRENLGDKMLSSLLGIRDVLLTNDDLFAILPSHPNPEVRRVVNEVFENIKNINICEPMPMMEFHSLLSRAFAVFSDSGGIQEEAAHLGVPLFLLRDKTERVECMSLPNVRLVGSEREAVKGEFEAFLSDKNLQIAMRCSSTIFGDGYASKKIAKIILKLRAEGKIAPLH